MPSFYVLAIDARDSSNIDGAKVVVQWTSGLGANLGTDTYYTDNLGRALIQTPQVFIIPTGASGRITVTKGPLIGEDVADVNAFGQALDHVISCTPDASAVTSTTIASVKNALTSGLKTTGWFAIGILVAIGIVLWGARGIIRR